MALLLGAMIAIVPYQVLEEVKNAAYASVILASVTMFSAGSLKTRATGGKWYAGGVEFFALGMAVVLVGDAVETCSQGLLTNWPYRGVPMCESGVNFASGTAERAEIEEMS